MKRVLIGTGQVISTFFVILLTVVIIFVMTPYESVSAASALTVEMQSAANSGANKDIIYNFTISFKDQVTSVNVTLVFNDDNNSTSVRPAEVNVSLLRNGTEVDSKPVSVKSDSGSSTFETTFGNLPLSDSNGEAYKYTISCTSTGTDAYNIVNSGNTVTYNIKKPTVTINYVGKNHKKLGSETFVVLYNASLTVTPPAESGYAKPEPFTINNIKSDQTHDFFYQKSNPHADSAFIGAKNTVDINDIRTQNISPRQDSASAMAEQDGSSQNYNLPSDIFNAAKNSNGTFAKSGDGTYTFSLKAGEKLVIPNLPSLVGYVIEFTGATFDGKAYTISADYFTIDGSAGKSTGGTAAGRPNVVFKYLPPQLTLTLRHKDIDTDDAVFPNETIKFDSSGNLDVAAKTTIEDYKPVGVTSTSYKGVTENKEYTFYYQSTIVPEGDVRIAGQVLWEDDNDALYNRPHAVDIELYCDGKIVGTKTVAVNEEEIQPFSFGNLPKESKEKKAYKYSVRQVPAAIDGYKSAVYQGGTEDGFIIINKKKPNNAIANLFSGNKDKNGEGVVLPIGSLTNSDNSSLFNFGAALVGLLTAIAIALFGIVALIKEKRKKAQAKPKRSKALRTIAAVAGLSQVVLYFLFENTALPIAGFNANSIFYIPLSFLMLVSVVMFAFSNKKARGYKADLQSEADFNDLPPDIGNYGYNDNTQNNCNAEDTGVEALTQQEMMQSAAAYEWQNNRLDNINYTLTTINEANLEEESSEWDAKKFFHDFGAVQNEAKKEHTEEHTKKHIEKTKEHKTVVEPTVAFKETAIKNYLIDQILTGLHGTEQSTAPHETAVKQFAGELSESVQTQAEFEPQTFTKSDTSSYDSQVTQTTNEHKWFGDSDNQTA